HVASIAPTVYANSRNIREPERLQPANALDMVADLDLAKAARDVRLEPQSAPRRAAIIELQDDEAVLRQHLRSQVHRLRPAVVHHLRPRTAVDGDDHGGAARRRRAIDGRMQLDPIAGS